MQRTQFYNFSTDGPEFSVKFYLYNTINDDSFVKNNESLVEVTVEETPEYNRTVQTCTISTTPVKQNGNYVLSWITENLPVEQASTNVNARVRNLLTGSDWTQVTDWDSGLTAAQKQTAAAYRQSLREVSSQQGFPYTVQYPAEPNFMAATPE